MTQADSTPADLEAELSQVELAIAAGEGDALELGRRRLELREAVSVARARAEAEAQAAYRARQETTIAEFLGRADPVMTSILGELIPRLLFALPKARALAEEAQRMPWRGVASYDEVFGVPIGFFDALEDCIRKHAPETEWDFSGAAPPSLGLSPARPALRGPRSYTLRGLLQRDAHGNYIRPARPE